jgi:predicted aldo/keto reductase-like oxidoreductase
MPCPSGIDVPRVFEIYNDAFMYQDFTAARAIYQEEGHNADMCTECGICAGRCAKRLDIPELLMKVRELIPYGYEKHYPDS